MQLRRMAIFIRVHRNVSSANFRAFHTIKYVIRSPAVLGNLIDSMQVQDEAVKIQLRNTIWAQN